MPEAQLPLRVMPHAVRNSFWVSGLFGLAVLLVFHQTTWSMVSIWLRSGTFTHGFLILPIALWLVWDKRDLLRRFSPRPAPWVVVFMIPPGFAWLLAWVVDVLVLQQLALVAMLVVGVWAILGSELARALAFPLFFLFFAVPMGEGLVPPMMDFTATSTVWLIQKTGIPVYREGLYFTLPSGNWSVVEACSGVRYLIASITLGVLFAYLNYYSRWRRALFVLASAIVPIFANTMRAYIIVMLGHLSDMTVATGVDHLIYGWLFFGLVMFFLFWLGSFFREDDHVVQGVNTSNPQVKSERPSRILAIALIAFSVAAVWPLLALALESRMAAGVRHEITLPESSGEWRVRPQVNWEWQPDAAVAGQVVKYYEHDGLTLGLFVQYPDETGTGGEIVGSSRRFTAQDSAWRVLVRDKVSVKLGDRIVWVDRARLKNHREQILAWSWYRIGDKYTSNDYLAKFQEAAASLGFGHSASFRVVLAMPVGEEDALAEAGLQSFLDQYAGALSRALDSAGENAP